MTQTTGIKRWMPLLLGISLAINLAVVAAVAGAAWRYTGEHEGARHKAKGGPVLMQALPREARQAVRAQLRAHHGQSADPAALLEVLRAEPFDAQAARSLVATQLRASRVSRQSVEAAWLAQVTAMTPDARLAYAARIEEMTRARAERLGTR